MKGVFIDPAPHPPLRLLPIHSMPVVMLLAVPFSHSPNVFAVVVGANQKDWVTVMKGLHPWDVEGREVTLPYSWTNSFLSFPHLPLHTYHTHTLSLSLPLSLSLSLTYLVCSCQGLPSSASPDLTLPAPPHTLAGYGTVSEGPHVLVSVATHPTHTCGKQVHFVWFNHTQ